ncbi:DUF3949 domain-containing protein [Halobacillus locisalis]|uniref:DUF3949 domain-containing protein n=1 Tax=Halobacillus locisalis TaxID=220753 RepID=A0A838CUP1_9BACI|nr:DUF3949 domain-containing protein [Halobacillus locisalis]MBA2175700.1 DUF3949 domain-containing protein [Halobacillus locisalis]
MLFNAFLGIAGIYVLLSILLTPLQYRYLEAMKEEQKENQTQQEYFESMPIQEEVLHVNNHVNPLFFLVNFFRLVDF